MNQNHVSEIDEIILLLHKYKDELLKHDTIPDKNLITLIDNDFYNIKDKIYLFFSNRKKTEIDDPKLIDEVDEYISTTNHIKELYPIILNYLMYKNGN